MAFCSNCGTQLQDGAAFCASCGSPAGGVAPATSSAAAKPTTEKVGNIRKCPSCGADVPAMAAVCSGCGHEFSGVKVASSVQEFFKEIQELDSSELSRNIQKEDQEKMEKSSSSSKAGIGTILKWLFFYWILGPIALFKKAKGPFAIAFFALGIVAFYAFLMAFSMTSLNENGKISVPSLIVGILAIIAMVILLIIMKPKMSPHDKQRKSLIEHFPIPNSKEDLIEFIILATSEIKPVENTLVRLFSLKAKGQLEWNNIWATKCKQVYTKARISLKNDPVSLTQISELMAETGLKTARSIN
jgi:hypothetical protein